MYVEESLQKSGHIATSILEIAPIKKIKKLE